jgi:hypothetical protein
VTASVQRRTSFSRALVALGGVALLSLLALAVLLLGGAFTEQGHATHATYAEGHRASVVAPGEHDHTVPQLHAIRLQPSTRARSTAFAILSSAAVVAAWGYRRLHTLRAGRLRTLRIPGLPPGRAPPALRIV